MTIIELGFDACTRTNASDLPQQRFCLITPWNGHYEVFWMSSWHSSEDEVQSHLGFFACLIFLEFFFLPEPCVCAGIWFGWLCPSVLVLQLCALPTLLWK